MKKHLRLLLIDDSDGDARRIVQELEGCGYELAWERVDTLAALCGALDRQPWDVVTCDWSIPGCDRTALLRAIADRNVDTPIILVSDQVDDAKGVAVIPGRVHDFISKRTLARLGQAVAREMQATELRRAGSRVEHDLRLGTEIAKQLSEGVYLIRTGDQRIVFTNPRFDQMFGYAPGELIGKHVSIVNADLDKSPQEIASEITAALAKHGRWQGDVHNRRKDGTPFWCYASVSTFEHPDFGSVWVSIHQDITDRKRAQEALQESEERYRSLVAASAQVVWTTDAAGAVVEDCPSWRAFTGQTQEEIKGSGWLGAVHPDDRAGAAATWAAARERGDLIEQEYRVRRHDGEYRDFEVRGLPVRANDGTIRQWIGTCADITDLKRAREQLQSRHAELAHVLRVNTIGELAAALAHEINQPLSAIANYANGCKRLLSSEPTSSKDLLPALEEISTEAMRAAEIIRRLRMLVQAQEPPCEETDLNAVVADAVHVLTPQARQLRIPIHVELAADLPPINVDPIQIEQVVVNLILNAFEAMKAGDQPAPELSVQTACHGDGTIEVSVCDNGIGLSPAVAERMFEPFYTSKPSGLGMGLTISRSIVDRQGGRLWATRNNDRGTTFHIALPLARGEDEREGGRGV